MENKVLNYIYGVQIKMTEEKGRGLFASKDLKEGDLLIVEKAVAEVQLPRGDGSENLTT